MKPLHWRRPARHDAMEAAKWYGREAGRANGERFLAAVDASLARIAHHPSIGSTRYALPLQLADLRFWPVDGFPYLVFYIERDDRIDVWRVLHEKRDIPAWMGDTK